MTRCIDFVIIFLVETDLQPESVTLQAIHLIKAAIFPP